MKQFLLLAGSALLSVGLNAQVGINTKSPKATLDLVTKTNIGKSLRVENTSGDETFTVTNTGLLGIRNSAPEYGVDVVGNNATNSSLRLTRYATGIAGPHISLAESKGSLTSPQPVEKGNYLGEIWWKGYDGKKFQGLSFIMSRVEGELQEGKTIPSSLMFYTTDYDTPDTGRSESMVIRPDGRVGIGEEDPQGTLDVHYSHKLEKENKAQGILPPRMSTAQRDKMQNIVSGLIIYNTSTNCLQIYDGTDWGCVSRRDQITEPAYPSGPICDYTNGVIGSVLAPGDWGIKASYVDIAVNGPSYVRCERGLFGALLKTRLKDKSYDIYLQCEKDVDVDHPTTRYGRWTTIRTKLCRFK